MPTYLGNPCEHSLRRPPLKLLLNYKPREDQMLCIILSTFPSDHLGIIFSNVS
jgi:hypothetical protein